eukprot:TRINITY_DN32026_c0_g1_i1.p1 TRINITY_DN32026_c0_g1~~TRINITY_DN32026_c0_g1_i1.p1  ORF type:complete len:600 (+),score=181.29 TRINITY_DN32026_c0_g1_i1:102-1901(+)
MLRSLVGSEMCIRDRLEQYHSAEIDRRLKIALRPMFDAQDRRLEEFESILLEQTDQKDPRSHGECTQSQGVLKLLVEQAEARIQTTVQRRFDQELHDQQAIQNSAIVQLQAQLDQARNEIEILKQQRDCEGPTAGYSGNDLLEEGGEAVRRHEDRLGKHERDIACLGRRDNATGKEPSKEKLSAVEARLRTDMKRNNKLTQDKLDAALRKVGELQSRMESELEGIEKTCAEFEELTEMMGDKLGSNCSDVQLLDESLAGLKHTVKQLADGRGESEAGLEEQLQELDARFSVLSDQYSGTTDMFSRYIDRNQEDMTQLHEKSRTITPELEALRVGLETMQAELETVALRSERTATQVADSLERDKVSKKDTAELVPVPSTVDLDEIKAMVEDMSEHNQGYHEATSQLMATVADLEEMQHTMKQRLKSDVRESALAVVDQKLPQTQELMELIPRIATMEKSQRQLGQSCRTLKESVNRSVRDLVQLNMNELKQQLSADDKKACGHMSKKLSASNKQLNQKFHEFEDKLLNRVAEIISDLQASKAEHQAVEHLDKRLETVEAWGTPADKRVQQLQHDMAELHKRPDSLGPPTQGQVLSLIHI